MTTNSDETHEWCITHITLHEGGPWLPAGHTEEHIRCITTAHTDCERGRLDGFIFAIKFANGMIWDPRVGYRQEVVL